MKIIFLNTPQEDNAITRDMAGGLGFDATQAIVLPPIDFALLAAILRSKKHQVQIIDPIVDKLSATLAFKRIIRQKPDIVICSFSLPSINSDASFAKKLKATTSAKIYAKTSITFVPILKKFLTDSQVDACLLGESERLIDKIVTGKTKRGLAFIRAKKITVNMPVPPKNLNILPLPARDLLKNKRYQYPLLGKNVTSVQSSRGCPYSCGFYCPYPLVQGRAWRPMNPSRVYRELEDIVIKHRIKRVLFRDATFTLNKKRTVGICKKIIKNQLKFSWWCETRLNCLDEELLTFMAKAGCKGINVGVETGDDQLMQKQGKPGVNLALLEKTKKITDRLKIKLHFLLLIGLPEETRKSVYQTFKMVKKLKPHSLGVTVVTPYPGTQLYAQALKKGWVESQDWSRYSGNAINMHTDNLKSWEMKLAQKLIILESMLLKKGFWGRIGLFFEDKFFWAWSRI